MSRALCESYFSNHFRDVSIVSIVNTRRGLAAVVSWRHKNATYRKRLCDRTVSRPAILYFAKFFAAFGFLCLRNGSRKKVA